MCLSLLLDLSLRHNLLFAIKEFIQGFKFVRYDIPLRILTQVLLIEVCASAI